MSMYEGLPKDKFDQMIGQLHGLPDVTETQPTTKNITVPLLGYTQTWTVHTIRQQDNGDTVFIQCGDATGYVRLAIPPSIADMIARQRDTLTSKVRRKHARRIAAERKAAGIVPGFLRAKKKK